MNSPRVVTHAGLSVNMSQVKCFKLNNFEEGSYKLKVEFKTRYDYIKHPNTGEWQKQEYNEMTEIEFPSYETASAYSNEWIEIWQDYLDDQG